MVSGLKEFFEGFSGLITAGIINHTRKHRLTELFRLENYTEIQDRLYGPCLPVDIVLKPFESVRKSHGRIIAYAQSAVQSAHHFTYPCNAGLNSRRTTVLDPVVDHVLFPSMYYNQRVGNADFSDKMIIFRFFISFFLVVHFKSSPDHFQCVFGSFSTIRNQEENLFDVPLVFKRI